MNDFILSAIVVLSGGIACLFVGKWLQLRPLFTIVLFTWHTILAYFFSNYILENGGDALVYYEKARFEFVELSLGTEFIVWLSSIPVSLGFTYWPLSFLFSTMGAIGLIFFYSALRDTAIIGANSIYAKLLILICIFLPSASFWTSGIGKDAISFMSAGLFLWAVMKLGRRQVGAFAAVLIMMPVRPHIAVLMVLSTAAGTVFVSDLRASVRFGVAALATAGAVFFVPLALVYSGSTRFSSIGEYISDRQEQNLAGGSSIDIAGMNPGLRLLSYLYRPLPNEAAGFAQLAASIDNLVLIGLTIAGIIAVYRAGTVKVFRHYSIPLLYGITSLIMLSQVTANLGLAARQKWMVVPALLLVLVGAWGLAAAETARKRRLGGPRIVMAQPQP